MVGEPCDVRAVSGVKKGRKGTISSGKSAIGITRTVAKIILVRVKIPNNHRFWCFS